MIDILNAAILGVIEGITEWLPISSTGHLILAELLFPLHNASAEFKEMFDVVIQLGAICAVILLFWNKLWPFTMDKTKHYIKKETWGMWFKVLVAIVPTVLIALPLDDWFNKKFYNWQTIAFTLIFYGILFIVVEYWRKNKPIHTKKLSALTYQTALCIGIFQVLSVIPGTSRSGATILGALILGVARPVAAEFTFFLAIPTMFGASLLKGVKFIISGVSITGLEIGMLCVGSVVAFIVSLFAIGFLMRYVKKHDFKVFGWYRIALGIVVLVYFGFIAK
ncbi:MAG: undecaprenyl-diphosphate phosphatase [Oscillospiraceae bacterium]